MTPLALPVAFWFLTVFSAVVSAQAGASCNDNFLCLSGCCSKNSTCGFGSEFCGDGCLSSCDAVAQCSPQTKCPLNACCSQTGYCGITEEFCGSGCQNGCDNPNRPNCNENTDVMALNRRVAYYLVPSANNSCDTFGPEQIPGGALTHINIASASIGTDFKIIDPGPSIVARVSRLKARYQDLRVYISIGGWASDNNPIDVDQISLMASTQQNRATFISSLTAFILKYGLDGVDIDWQYPGAFDLGSSLLDLQNYVALLAQTRQVFNQTHKDWGLTVTLPISYWYLKGFDVSGIQEHVDWFNIMSYDMHGIWDQEYAYTGPYLRGHTNTTELDEALDVLWRNKIDPSKVVMGFGFFARSLSMSDPSCQGPTCTYTGPGTSGPCSQTAGFLSYGELANHNNSLNDVTTHYDTPSTVKFEIYNGDQWISYDDEQSFTDKKKFLFSRCLGGLNIWAINQDTVTYQALSALFGDAATRNALVDDGDLTDQEKINLVNDFSAYTGQNCYASSKCFPASNNSTDSNVCDGDDISVAIAHEPKGDFKFNNTTPSPFAACSQGSYHHICCPKNALPQNCKWKGNPDPSNSDPYCTTDLDNTASCGNNSFVLNTDEFKDPAGNTPCGVGHRSLCCDSTKILDECQWQGCQDPLETGASCPEHGLVFSGIYRLDDVNGKTCPLPKRTNFCCPQEDTYKNCEVAHASPPTGDNNATLYDPQSYCAPAKCPNTKVKIDKLYDPHVIAASTHQSVDYCRPTYSINDTLDGQFSLCCDPPDTYDSRWPVDPQYLWQNYSASDVAWAYADNYGNNDMDNEASEEYGQDAYGFVELAGTEGSLNNHFAQDFTVVRREAAIPILKRSLLTKDKRRLEQTFQHKEEVIHVFCNHHPDSKECSRLWISGVEDTIIKLPNHIGEGPFARIVSMERIPEGSFDLPHHHVEARKVHKNFNPIYRLTFDYNFHLIKRAADEKVSLRVDFTNLLGYWDNITNSTDKTKRSSETRWRMPRPGTPEFEQMKSSYLSKRSASFSSGSTNFTPAHVSKRGIFNFRGWLSALKKLFTVEQSSAGSLPAGIAAIIPLYSYRRGCPGSTISVGMEITAEAEIDLNARYAYYFSGTIVPPVVTDSYAYFGMDPQAYLGIQVIGNARLQYQSQRKKIIDTLAYPGLSIKGIATVGPSFDLYGQLTGNVELAGDMQIGTQVNFPSSEWYYPDNPDSASYNKISGLLDDTGKPHSTDSLSVKPIFDASVKASADFNVLVTPEVNLGIQVGSDPVTLVDARITAFNNNTVNFHAEASASTGGPPSYSYGVYYIYNIGFTATASFIRNIYSWQAKAHLLFPTNNGQNRIVLYENNNTASSKSKREFKYTHRFRRGLLNDDSDTGYTPSKSVGLLELPGRSDADRLVVRKDVDPTAVRNESSTLKERFDMFSIPATTFLQGALECPDRLSCVGTPVGDGPQEGNITKRAPTTDACEEPLPLFIYNCDYFADIPARTPPKEVSPAQPQREVTVLGICSNIQRYIRLKNGGNPQVKLTYNPRGWNGKKESAVRPFVFNRDQVCPTGYCAGNNEYLQGHVGGAVSLGWTSCDEFPFHTTEQGGLLSDQFGRPDIAASLANPTELRLLPFEGSSTDFNSQQCAPVTEQNIQANCNRLPGYFRTNVNRKSDGSKIDANAPDSWQNWGSSGGKDGKLPDPWLAKSNWQDVVGPYPADDVRSPKLNSMNPAPANDMSWKWKRNYGLSLITTAKQEDWPNGFKSAVRSSKGRAFQRAAKKEDVVCAITPNGNKRVEVQPNMANAYCRDLSYNTPDNSQRQNLQNWVGDLGKVKIVQCKVTWNTDSPPTIRSVEYLK